MKVTISNQNSSTRETIVVEDRNPEKAAEALLKAKKVLDRNRK